MKSTYKQLASISSTVDPAHRNFKRDSSLSFGNILTHDFTSDGVMSKPSTKTSAYVTYKIW